MEKEKKNTKNKKTVTKPSTKSNNAKKVTSNKTSSKTKEVKKGPVVKPVPEVKTVAEKSEIKTNSIKNEVRKDSSSKFGGEEIRKLLIVIGAVCAVMLAFYFITEVVLKNKKDDNNKTENEVKVEPEIQYEKILMGSILNQNEVDYYVLVYDDEDAMVEVYNQYINKYKETEDPLKVYKVDLSDDFNKSYIAEESYLTGNDVSKIRVTETTLIRVSKKEVYKSFVGQDAIIGRLKYMLG